MRFWERHLATALVAVWQLWIGYPLVPEASGAVGRWPFWGLGVAIVMASVAVDLRRDRPGSDRWRLLAVAAGVAACVAQVAVESAIAPRPDDVGAHGSLTYVTAVLTIVVFVLRILRPVLSSRPFRRHPGDWLILGIPLLLLWTPPFPQPVTLIRAVPTVIPMTVLAMLLIERGRSASAATQRGQRTLRRLTLLTWSAWAITVISFAVRYPDIFPTTRDLPGLALSDQVVTLLLGIGLLFWHRVGFRFRN